jgi:3-methyladenine DNA glycosylase AlkD
MAKYMKNHFPFFGIKSKEREVLFKQFLKENPPPQLEEAQTVAWELYTQPDRECHYCAIALMAHIKKQWTVETIDFFEKLIIHQSWWDSVDYISGELVSEYFKKYPFQKQAITARWMASNNIWLQRVCLIFQLKYKKQTDTALLVSFIRQLNGSKEFFIQKAIGWALRQYARTDAAWVQHFAETTPLMPLSKREALKHF